MELTTNKDYRINGYFKKKVNNSKGDRAVIEYYLNYDSEAPEPYSGLKVKETRTYTRNPITGVLEKIEVLIQWMSSDGVTPREEKTLIKHLDIDDGMKANEASRGRLLNEAKRISLESLGLQNGLAFMRNLGPEISLYREGDIQPLIDAINASSQSQTLKDDLTLVLNITYTS